MNLSDRLHAAADRPVDVPDLLPRARAARARQRTLAAVGVMGVVAAGTAAVSLWPSPTTPALPAAPATPSVVPEAAALTPDQILERCADQLAAHDASPRFADLPADGWGLAHPERTYTDGDLVALVQEDQPERAYLPKLCLLTDEPVDPLTDLVPTTDSPLLAAFVAETAPLSAALPEDFRDAQVPHATEAGGIVGAILELDGERWTALASPLAYDFGRNAVYPVVDTTEHIVGLAEALGSNAGKASGPAGAWWMGAGSIAEDAATIELSGPVEATFPVVDGAFVVVAHDPDATGLERAHVRVLAEDGTVLSEE